MNFQHESGRVQDNHVTASSLTVFHKSIFCQDPTPSAHGPLFIHHQDTGRARRLVNAHTALDKPIKRLRPPLDIVRPQAEKIVTMQYGVRPAKIGATS